MFYRDGHQKNASEKSEAFFCALPAVSGEGFRTALSIELSGFNMQIKINS